MTNKEASYNQEHMVANFLGWQVVSGSGSRPFSPGDIKNENYLLECKTHTKEQSNIVFYKNHWDKICKEARSVNKYPALVVDEGSQRAENTWVMIPKRVIPVENINQVLHLVNTSTSHNTVTFANQEAKDIYKLISTSNSEVDFFEDSFGDEPLAILSLTEFKKFYQEQFES